MMMNLLQSSFHEKGNWVYEESEEFIGRDTRLQLEWCLFHALLLATVLFTGIVLALHPYPFQEK